MESQSQTREKTYHTNIWNRVGYLISYPTLLVGIGLLSWQIVAGNDLSVLRRIMYLFVILLCMFALYICLVDWNAHLEVSTDGVAYYGCGFHIYTPWQNIIRISQMRHPSTFLDFRRVNVFVLRSPALLGVPISEGKRRGVAVIEKHWLVLFARPRTYYLYFPLISDNLAKADLSEHELGIYIRQYAPQVFRESLLE